MKKPSKRQYELVLTQWILISTIFFYFTYQIAPHIFLKPVLDNYFKYLGGVIIYGFLSVLPQMIIFRSFLFKRYKFITKDWKGILLSAILFSYSHIVLGNYFALILTFVAGLVFSYRYVKTGSFRIVWLEHFLYGGMIFATGLDFLFYTPLIIQ